MRWHGKQEPSVARDIYARNILDGSLPRLLFTFLRLFCHFSRVSLRLFAGIKVACGWEMLKLLVNVGIRVTARKTLQRRRISPDVPRRFSGLSDHTVRPFEIFSWSLFAFLRRTYGAYLLGLLRHIVSLSFSSLLDLQRRGFQRQTKYSILCQRSAQRRLLCNYALVYRTAINYLRFLVAFQLKLAFPPRVASAILSFILVAYPRLLIPRRIRRSTSPAFLSWISNRRTSHRAN